LFYATHVCLVLGSQLLCEKGGKVAAVVVWGTEPGSQLLLLALLRTLLPMFEGGMLNSVFFGWQQRIGNTPQLIV
jgi:hypothetical protein